MTLQEPEKDTLEEQEVQQPEGTTEETTLENTEVELPELTPELYNELSSKINNLTSEKEILDKRMRDKDSYISKIRNSELKLQSEMEQIRKEMQDITPQLPGQDQEYIAKDQLPVVQKYHNLQNKEQDLLVRQQELKTEQYINSTFPDFKELVDDIAELAKSKGESERNIADFKDNPYTTPPSVLASYIELARLNRENKRLREEKEKAAKIGEDHLNKINRAANTPPPVKNSTGKSSYTSKSSFSPEEVYSMTSEERQKVINDMKAKGTWGFE